MTRLARLLVAAGLALAGAAVPAAAQAEPVREPARTLPATTIADSCLREGKVWLLVVNEHGGTVFSGCVSSFARGSTVLNAAGYTTNKGMVCSIGGYGSCPRPGVYSDPYWSYWHASPGGGYSYSTLGASSYRPKAGTIEAWCFTPAGSESEQQSTCRNWLTSKLNPANVSLAEPTKEPTTTKPTTKPTVAPTTSRPTVRPTATSTTRPTTRRPVPTAKRPQPKPTLTAAPRPTASGSPSRSARPSVSPSTSTQPSTTPSGRATPTAPVTSPVPSASSPVPSTSSSAPATPSAAETPVVATVMDSGTPWGTVTAGSAVGLGAMTTAGWVWWRRRQQ